MKIILLPQAQEDLASIAEPLLSKVIKRLRTLALYPSMGAAMSGLFSGYRGTVVGNFRVVYKQPEPATIHIAYIRHCRRSAPEA